MHNLESDVYITFLIAASFLLLLHLVHSFHIEEHICRFESENLGGGNTSDQHDCIEKKQQKSMVQLPIPLRSTRHIPHAKNRENRAEACSTMPHEIFLLLS